LAEKRVLALPRRKLALKKEVEMGKFFRVKYYKDGKTKQKTVKTVGNPLKVTLGKIGDLEFYVYPYDYPETVFLGIYPISVELDEKDYRKLFGILNRVRWFLRGEWQKTPKKASFGMFMGNTPRQSIVRAYNLGLNEKRRTKNASLH
jgi:hypothetical protein